MSSLCAGFQLATSRASLSASSIAPSSSAGELEIDEQSGGSARPYPVRAGDVIKPRIDIPEWIVGYAERGTQDVLIAPKLENYKAPAKNTTGAKYAAGVKYEVVEVSVMPVLGQDDVVWLQLIPR